MENDSEQIDPETNGKGGNKMEAREAGGVWHDSITIGALLDFPTFQNGETNFFQSHSGSQTRNHIIAPPLTPPPHPHTKSALESLPLLPALLFRAPAVCSGGWGWGVKITEHCGILRL